MIYREVKFAKKLKCQAVLLSRFNLYSFRKKKLIGYVFFLLLTQAGSSTPAAVTRDALNLAD